MEMWSHRQEVSTYHRLTPFVLPESKAIRLLRLDLGALSHSLQDLYARENLPHYLTGFFLGRASLLGLSPFGFSYLAFLLGSGSLLRFWLTVLAVFLGGLSNPGQPLLPSLLTLSGLLFWDQAFRRHRPAPLLLAFLAALTSLGGHTLGELALYQHFAHPLPSVVEALLIFFFTAILRLGIEDLRDITRLKWAGKVLNSEELISLTLLLVCFFLGTAQIQYGPFSLAGVAGKVFILSMAFAGGSGFGAAAGILASAATAPGFSPELMATYALAGLLAGTRGEKKGGVALGFLLGGLLLSFHLPAATQRSFFLESSLALLFFLILPANLLATLARLLPGTREQLRVAASRQERLQELTTRRVENFAAIFQELARTFSQATTKEKKKNLLDFDGVMAQITRQICTDCLSRRQCWEQNCFDSYRDLLTLVAGIEERGEINDAQIPHLRKRCPSLPKMITTLRQIFAMYRLDHAWQRKLQESSQIVAGQLRGIARVMENLAGELKMDIHFEEETELILRQELAKLGFTVEELNIIVENESQTTIRLVRRPCGGEGECHTIAPLLSRLLGRTFSVWHMDCGHTHGGQCVLTFLPQRPYEVRHAVARRNREQNLVSGDSHALIELQDGKLAVALSDGMGCGPKAALESNATIGLLRRLLEVGFDRESAVQTVNSVLLLRSGEESFATIDLAVLDLFTGDAQFVKVGSAPSFIKRGRDVMTVEAASLPIGILNHIEVETNTRTLQHGDLLIMVSDGVTELRRSGGPSLRGDWVARALRQCDSDDPQTISDWLLEQAQAKNFGQVEDDMTVIVLALKRVEERKKRLLTVVRKETPAKGGKSLWTTKYINKEAPVRIQ